MPTFHKHFAPDCMAEHPEVRRRALELDKSRFKTPALSLKGCVSWNGLLTFLDFSSLICKTELTVATSSGFHKDQMRKCI